MPFWMQLKRYGGRRTIFSGARFYAPEDAGDGDGDGDKGGGGGAGDGDGDGDGDGAGGKGKGSKSFTQAQVNKIVADERRKTETKERTEHQKTLTQLEKLKKTAGLSGEEMKELNGRIEELEGLVLTKEEKAKKDLELARTKHEDDLKAAGEEAKVWRNRYASETIDRAILDAAVEHKAYNPGQIVDILRTKATLEEVKDKVQRPTGKFAPMVKMQVPSEDGKTFKEEMVSPTKAVEILKATTKFDNLFLAARAGGAGFRPTGAGTGAADSSLHPNQKIAAGLKSL